VLLHAALRLWREPCGERLVHACAGTLAAMSCCGLAVFGPWYHVWWVPLALLLERGWLHRFALAVVWLSPCGYVVWTFARRLDGAHQVAMLAMGVVLPALVALRRPAAPPVSAAPAA
jgi:hypothetical protein